MSDSLECPYCKFENDMTDVLSEGLSNDNTTDWECQNCEEEFEVLVEFEPSYSASKIEYIDCEKCWKSTREFYEKGYVFPYPKHLKENKVCKSCFLKAAAEELNSTN